MKWTEFLASMLTLIATTQLRAEEGLPGPSSREVAAAPMASEGRPADDPVPVQIISPWGFGGWYQLEPGLNILECTGTGNLFEYWN
jgi:hypothetical protein